MQFLKQLIKQQNFTRLFSSTTGLFMDWKLQTDIWVINYYIQQNFWNSFLCLAIHWIKDNALKSFGECIALLWLIETVDYLLPLLLPEWTVFSIAGNMCSKDLDKQHTLDIVFLFCTALFFTLMSLLQMYYIFFYLLWCIRPKCL